MRRLEAVDAQTYWMSAKVPNDQFLLYGFAGVPADLEASMQEIRARAQACGELTMRLQERHVLTYPVWKTRDVDDRQLVVHHLDDATWDGCLAAVSRLADDQLDASDIAWRLYVFTPVDGVPGSAGPGTVAVLQAAHALGDGTRSSALAALLFGRPGAVPAVMAPRLLRPLAFPSRSVLAGWAHRRLVRDTAAGHVPPQADSRPLLRSNARPAGARSVRTLIRQRSRLQRPVTAGVLAAVSTALVGHLRELGDDAARLGAEVPMAIAGPREALNHFSNVGVGLYPELEIGERTARIVEDLAARRQRAGHPAMRASRRAFASVPAPLLRWGVGQFNPDMRSPMVTGNTVVSSVNRGPADLRFGGARVVVTAGYPGLSPMMGLVHGVHGIGDTVAVSVHAAESAVGDVDAYVDRLEAALPG